MKAVAARGVLTLLLLAQPAVSQVPDDKLIVPGQRIGKWTLQMTISTLVQMNGRPDIERFDASDLLPPAFMRYRWPDFAAITRDGQRVEFLLVGSVSFKTGKNVGPGSTRVSVQTAYGTPTAETRVRPRRTRMIYDAIGFAANLDGDRVTGVNVFLPGTAKTIWKF